jgi:hypothetical protein
LKITHSKLDMVYMDGHGKPCVAVVQRLITGTSLIIMAFSVVLARGQLTDVLGPSPALQSTEPASKPILFKSETLIMELSMSETDPSSHRPEESRPDEVVPAFVSIFAFLGGKGWRWDSLPGLLAMVRSQVCGIRVRLLFQEEKSKDELKNPSKTDIDQPGQSSFEKKKKLGWAAWTHAKSELVGLQELL